jgi:hypothetical protein
VLGALGAVGLVLWAGRASGQPFLMVIMSVWVVSPFVLLALGDVVATSRWPLISAAFHRVGPVLAVGSLVVYAAAAFAPRGTRTTPVFVLVPPISWLVIGVTALLSRERAGR